MSAVSWRLLCLSLIVLGLSFVATTTSIIMGIKTGLAATAALLFSTGAFAAPALSNADTSLTFVYQNNLNASDDANHIGAIVLDPSAPKSAAKACAAIGETQLTQAAVNGHTADFQHALGYLGFAGLENSDQSYYLADAILEVQWDSGKLKTKNIPKSQSTKLPILCTQSSTANSANNAVANATNELTIQSGSNYFVGFRNQKSFRFVGVPYANPPARFEYSTVYSKTGQTIQATQYGADCAQAYDSTGSENCLFINIQTPYIPKAGSKKNLKPVLFSICLLYTSPSPRDGLLSRMPSSA